MRLTEDQRQLVEAHLDWAAIAAAKIRSSSIPYDERLSAAYLALCRLAGRYEPGELSFGSYLYRWLVKETLLEFRYIEPLVQLIDPEPLDALADAKDLFLEIELKDESRVILASLKPREREWLEVYSRTGNWSEVARKLGRHQSNVRRIKKNIRNQLRAAGKIT